MARLINNSVNPETAIKMVIHFEDGTSSEKLIRINDEVENLRYIENEELKEVSGIVDKIGTNVTKVTGVKPYKVEDYFAKDVAFRTITVDASEHFDSQLVSFPVREIVEDEGITNVTKIDFIPYPIVKMNMEYTDGSSNIVELVVGDVLSEFIGFNDKKLIQGTYRIDAMYYTCPKSIPDIQGFYLVPFEGGNAIKIKFEQIISFEKKTSAIVDDSTSLKAISEALAASEDGEVFATLGVDVEIPPRTDGRITTTMIDSGKTLNLDLNGHKINTIAYALYVNGGELNISDSTGEGKIECTKLGAAYPGVFVAAGGTCNMDGGIIDTTAGGPGTEETPNWMYGVVCSGDGTFNMTGGEIVTQDAAGISITNGTASGAGAQFIIGGTAKITSKDCCAIYLADNKSVVVKDKAEINGGIVARMGDIRIEDNAKVNGFKADAEIYPLGKLVCESGCENANAPILALTGCYNSDLGNDMNIFIGKNAKVYGFIDDGIDIATINTKFDQTVTVEIENAKSIVAPKNAWNIYNHATLAEMATEQGKTLPAETSTTTLTITIAGEGVYPPPPNEGLNEEEGGE